MGPKAKITCLCGELQEVVELISDIPVDSSSCSCNICRYTTGVLWLSCIAITTKPALIPNLQQYHSSEKLTRYFCGICGSHMLVDHEGDSWDVCSGVIDQVVGHEQVFSLQHPAQSEFTSDTLDGGLAICLATFHQKRVPLYTEGPDKAPITLTGDQQIPPVFDPSDLSGSAISKDETRSQSHRDDRLHAACHCGGVKFYITRPTPASSSCSSPWPDLLAPYHSSSSSNPTDVKWWLRSNRTKYLAGTCACRSCRLASGSPIQTWTFVPKVNLFQSNGTAIDYEFGSLRQVESSPGCYRNFCANCGASVFWHCEERPDLVDVSVGLLRAPEGSRAEDWLEWCTERVSFKEDALDKDLIEHLELGLRVLEGDLSKGH